MAKMLVAYFSRSLLIVSGVYLIHMIKVDWLAASASI